MHDVFWRILFPLNCFALGLCVGRYLTEIGAVPRRWPFGRKKASDGR